MNNHTDTPPRAPRRPTPPGMVSRYQAGTSQRALARHYRMATRTVRAHLVAAGVTIRSPRSQPRTTTPPPPAHDTTHPQHTPPTPNLATVHQLHPRVYPFLARVHESPHPDVLDADLEADPGPEPVFWPCAPAPATTLSSEPATAPPPEPASAVPGQPCLGLTTPDQVHKISNRPTAGRHGTVTYALTRCARVGIVTDSIPDDARRCPECHTTGDHTHPSGMAPGATSSSRQQRQ